MLVYVIVKAHALSIATIVGWSYKMHLYVIDDMVLLTIMVLIGLLVG